MNENRKREYTAPEIEMLSLAVEPFMLNEGLDVSDGDDYDIMPLATSGTWTPWV
ncbi:MAG: hypothetical protein J6K62_07200 [Clostridia bacterium]|nr:hypothetical protein [Clostridia bacterium]